MTGLWDLIRLILMNISSSQPWKNFTPSASLVSNSLTGVSPSLPHASGTSRPCGDYTGCTLAFSEREKSCVCSPQPAIISLGKRACERSRGQLGWREIRGGGRVQISSKARWRWARKVTAKPPLLRRYAQNDTLVPRTDARAPSARVPTGSIFLGSVQNAVPQTDCAATHSTRAPATHVSL
jgi:hypothetical protein